jgi:hypothetical protein
MIEAGGFRPLLFYELDESRDDEQQQEQRWRWHMAEITGPNDSGYCGNHDAGSECHADCEGWTQDQ